jgi:hypothetical protein
MGRVHRRSCPSQLSVDELVRRVFSSGQEDYVRLDFGYLTFFVDLVPPGPTESCEFAIEFSDPSFVPYVAEAHDRSATVPIGKDAVALLLFEYDREFTSKASWFRPIRGRGNDAV